MSGSKDTLIRQWHTLRAIPRYPSMQSTTELYQTLRDLGYSVTKRTVERNVDQLSNIFPISCEQRGRSQYWFWGKDANGLDLPSMDLPTALTFKLAQGHLQGLLPPQALELLSPWLKRAADTLSNANQSTYTTWENKIAVINNGITLKAPPVEDDVQRCVYGALMNTQLLTLKYSPRYKPTRDYSVAPLGIVLRGGVTYLVCGVGEDMFIIHLALHRINSAFASDQSFEYPSDFELQNYIDENLAFSFDLGRPSIPLVLHVDAGVAIHLLEQPIANDQENIRINDDTTRITATVENTRQLHWWILGFGDQMEVISPQSLRDEIANVLSSASNLYRRHAQRA